MISRIGISAVDISLYDEQKIGAIGWYCNWQYKGKLIPDVEYYPLVCGYVGKAMPDNYPEKIRDYILSHKTDYPQGTTWLIGNEIGYTEQNDFRTPLQYAKNYKAMYRMLKSLNRNYKVALGAIITTDHPYTKSKYVGGNGGIAYLEDVFKSYQNEFQTAMPVDVFNIHPYAKNFDSGMTDIDDVKKQVRKFRRFMAKNRYRDKTLIITEFGCPIGKTERGEVGKFMRDIFDYFLNATDDEYGNPGDDNRLIQRFAWFTLHDVDNPDIANNPIFHFAQTVLLDKKGRITDLGADFKKIVENMKQKKNCN